MIKTEIINGATYLTKTPKSKLDFIPICENCRARDICDEPSKERRITCPDETYERMHAEHDKR